MPKYVSLAKRAVDMHFNSDVAGRLEQAGFFNDPDFIRGFYAVGRSLVEDNILMGEEVETGGTGRSAQAELEALMGDPKGAYFDAMHPDHDKAVMRALDLRKFLAA